MSPDVSHDDASRSATLHLLIGEYDLAVREIPEESLITSPLHGWAWFNYAFALYMNGQYADNEPFPPRSDAG